MASPVRLDEIEESYKESVKPILSSRHGNCFYTLPISRLCGRYARCKHLSIHQSWRQYSPFHVSQVIDYDLPLLHQSPDLT